VRFAEEALALVEWLELQLDIERYGLRQNSLATTYYVDLGTLGIDLDKVERRVRKRVIESGKGNCDLVHLFEPPATAEIAHELGAKGSADR